MLGIIRDFHVHVFSQSPIVMFLAIGALQIWKNFCVNFEDDGNRFATLFSNVYKYCILLNSIFFMEYLIFVLAYWPWCISKPYLPYKFSMLFLQSHKFRGVFVFIKNWNDQYKDQKEISSNMYEVELLLLAEAIILYNFSLGVKCCPSPAPFCNLKILALTSKNYWVIQ